MIDFLFFEYDRVTCKIEKRKVRDRDYEYESLNFQIDDDMASYDIAYIRIHLDWSKRYLRDLFNSFYKDLREIHKMKKKYNNYEKEKGFFDPSKAGYKIDINNQLEKTRSIIDHINQNLAVFRILSSLYLAKQKAENSSQMTIDHYKSEYGSKSINDLYLKSFGNKVLLSEADVENLMKPLAEWE